jgi:hypothetical protein
VIFRPTAEAGLEVELVGDVARMCMRIFSYPRLIGI